MARKKAADMKDSCGIIPPAPTAESPSLHLCGARRCLSGLAGQLPHRRKLKALRFVHATTLPRDAFLPGREPSGCPWRSPCPAGPSSGRPAEPVCRPALGVATGAPGPMIPPGGAKCRPPLAWRKGRPDAASAGAHRRENKLPRRAWTSPGSSRCRFPLHRRRSRGGLRLAFRLSPGHRRRERESPPVPISCGSAHPG
jgi:hypothetical protein